MAEKYAVLGGAVEHSLSPKIYTYIAGRVGVDLSYEALSLGSAEDVASIIRGGTYDGLNITMPYKKDVLPYVSSMTEEVRAFMSANTLVREGSSYRAHSTDGGGFVTSLNYNGIEVTQKSVYLYGLGGASRPIAYALIKAGVSKLYYESRTEESEEEFRLILTQALGSDLPIYGARKKSTLDCDIAINASSFGTRPEARPSIDMDRVTAEVIYDIIYLRETELLKEARARGRRVIGGLDMLIAQALYAFKLFFPSVILPKGLFGELKIILEEA